jgi:2-dehydropantoate 2-reductase
MRILVVGAGATGGYFGGRLAEAGRDVTFLVRSARAAKLRRDGLRIVSPRGDATFRPRLVTIGDIASGYDVVLVSGKAYALERALEDFAL